MTFSSITIGSTVWSINRPPNNVEDLVQGEVVQKIESEGGAQFVVVRSSEEAVMAKTYTVLPADVYTLKADAVDALEDIYEADASTKTAYIASLRA